MKTQARLREANREQMCLEVLDYNELIPEDHPARMIVKFVEQLNIEGFYSDIKSLPGEAGRPATDPKLLLCLWLYATVEGIGSARLLEKLCERDNTFHRRMENKISQKYYKLRSRIETFNGILHNRMPGGFYVRGLEKVKSELLLHVVSHNIMRAYRLGAIA